MINQPELRYRRGLGHDIFDHQKYIVWAALGILFLRGDSESKIDDVEILPIRSRLTYWVGVVYVCCLSLFYSLRSVWELLIRERLVRNVITIRQVFLSTIYYIILYSPSSTVYSHSPTYSDCTFLFSIAGNRKHITSVLANKNIKKIIIHFPPPLFNNLLGSSGIFIEEIIKKIVSTICMDRII